MAIAVAVVIVLLFLLLAKRGAKAEKKDMEMIWEVKFKEGKGFLSENLDQMLEKREWRTRSHSFGDLLDTPFKNENYL